MDKIYIVMDYVEHDMKSLMETMKNPFLMGQWLCNLVEHLVLQIILTFSESQKDFYNYTLWL